MPLTTVTAGDVAQAEHLNQVIRLLKGTDAGDITLTNGSLIFGSNAIQLKTLTGSVAGGATSTIAHSLGRVPRFILGYSGTNQANADAGSNVILITNGATASFYPLLFDNGSGKAADGTNIYIKNQSSPSATWYYRVYLL